MNRARAGLPGLLLVVLMLLAGSLWASAGAQLRPLVPPPDERAAIAPMPTESAGERGLFGDAFAYIQRQQRALTRSLSEGVGAVRRAEPGAVIALLTASFAYGVFHAAGPGHGKVVISTYLLASGRTVRRGVVLSLAASMAQAVTAIMLVGGLAALIGIASRQVAALTGPLEAASYFAVALLGLYLLWRGLGWRAPWAARHAALAGPAPKTSAPAMALAATSATGQGARPAGVSRSHAPEQADGPGRHWIHGHNHPHDHPADCGHAHGPSREMLEREVNWREAGGIVAAIGLRPCSGAIIVLLLTLSQGIFFWGVAATVVMALGTGLAISLLAILAVSSKELALRFSGAGEARVAQVLRGLKIAGGAVLLFVGAVLFAAALTAPPPPLI